MIAMQTYASDHNDRQFTAAPDNLASGDRTGMDIEDAIDEVSVGGAYPWGVRLGEYEGSGVIYFISIDPWYGGETGGVAPYCFQSGLTTSSTGKAGYGVWRYPNAMQVAEYMEGMTLHGAYFAPKDTVPLKVIEDCDDLAGSYCPTTGMVEAVGTGTAAITSNLMAIPSSYCISPAMMYNPSVYQYNIAAGQRPTDPMELPRGFKPPSIDQARFPAHKSWLMEHNWLQNLSANECSRRLVGSWFLNGDGCYDGCEPSHYNAHPDSEPVTVFADGATMTYSLNDFIIDDELSKENNDPWDTQGLWLRNLGSFGFDNGSSLGYFSEANEIVGVRWSGHTHTKFGIRGRDKIAK